MVSIFKAVKDNNVDYIRDLIQLMTNGGGGGGATTPANPERRQQLQRYLKATGQKQFNFNKRSIYGRTALHCAATWNRIDIVRLLLECPMVNVNVQDRENGWTALHRALYCGHLAIALELLRHPDIDLKIKDWEGIRPVELPMILLGNTKPLERRLVAHADTETNPEEDVYSSMATKETATRSLGGGTDLYTWGSNTNYVLGHSDSENRMYPERVHLNLESQHTPNIITRPDVLILDVRMSKYHTAVLTSEPRNNLLLCGFGHGGRLGNGKEVDTQLTLMPVYWPERISAVALGKDHTVAVSERGNVITFGSNEHCQLGYETADKFQLLPRKVQAPSLKRQAIIGAAASSVHTVVYTTMDIFTFGYNQGQLGYHASGDEVHQLIPRKVTFPTRIKDVAATDYATALLFESHEIVLLCNFTQQKIILPTDRFPMNIQVHSSSANFPVKLLSGGEDYMGALSNNGEVYIWTCRGSRNSDKSKAKDKPLTHVGSPKRSWILKKSYLEATDASIGHHGDLVVSTLSGQVFVGKSTKEGSYKFNMIPNLQRCVRVSASPSGAFAAIRSEVQVDPIKSVPSTFVNDIATALPHMVVGRRLEDKLADIVDERDKAIARLEQQAEEEQNADPRRQDEIHFDYETRIANAVHLAWQEADEMAAMDETLDTAFVLEDGRKVYCHRCIISSRSRFLAQVLEKDGFEHPSFNVTVAQNRKDIQFTCQKVSIAAILLLIEWLYTDTYTHPMGAYYTHPALSRAHDMHVNPAKVQKDLVALAALFELEELYDSASRSFGHTPRPSLSVDLLKLFESGKGVDVILELKDGQLASHEVILRQRCGFFGTLFEPGSIWMQARREGRTPEDPLLHVFMTHATKATVEPLLRYLYGDLDEHGLFDEMIQETPEAMMRYLIEMLCLADELLLSRLKTACERALVKFLKLRSATTLLEAADQYMADALKDACLQFISTNLDIFMATGMLDHLDSRLIHAIEVYVQQCQADEMPFVRRPSFTPAGSSMKGEDDQEDVELSTSLYTLSREDQPIITNYIEVYTTLLPEPAWAVKSSDEEDRMFPLDEDQPAIEQRRQKRRDEKGKQRALPKKQLSIDPTSTSTPKLGWAANASRSTGTKMSFRAIMEQQPSEAAVDSNVVVEQSSTPPSSLGKSPPRHALKKMSQKERRKLQQLQQLQQEQLAAAPKPVWGKVTPTPLVTPPSESLVSFPPVVAPSVATTPAAGTAVSPTVPEADMASTSPLGLDGSSSKGKKIYVAKEDLMNESMHHRRDIKNEQEAPRFDPVRSLGASFLLTPIRRQRGSHDGPHRDSHPQIGSATGSFHVIQKQQELEDLWIKSKQARKSLVRIQTEERAIENLKEFYVQTLDATTGEWVDIDRLDP